MDDIVAETYHFDGRKLTPHPSMVTWPVKWHISLLSFDRLLASSTVLSHFDGRSWHLTPSRHLNSEVASFIAELWQIASTVRYSTHTTNSSEYCSTVLYCTLQRRYFEKIQKTKICPVLCSSTPTSTQFLSSNGVIGLWLILDRVVASWISHNPMIHVNRSELLAKCWNDC